VPSIMKLNPSIYSVFIACVEIGFTQCVISHLATWSGQLESLRQSGVVTKLIKVFALAHSHMLQRVYLCGTAIIGRQVAL
jgi:hypothetical protein